jgi:transglutaminase-like putative cysteine protease/peroxiredoxin
MKKILPLITLLILIILPSGIGSAAAEIKLPFEKYQGLTQAIDKNPLKDQIYEALKDAGSNWENLAKAIVSLSGQKQDDLLWQITVMPHLDRLEATSDILIEHVDYAYLAKDSFAYKIPENMFREYILVYRIGDEPVTRWRKMIFDQFKSSAGNTPAETAKNVNKWVADNVTVRERGFFGPKQSADQVLKLKMGTKDDIALLTTAILKALGVPSRSARCTYFGEQKAGASWVEIFEGANWIPLYPDDPASFGDFKKYEKDYPHNITAVATLNAFSNLQITGSYTDTGTVEMTFIKHGVPQQKYEHFGISVYNDGGWMPLDDLWDDETDQMVSEKVGDAVRIVLGDGTYLVQAGTRVTDGSVYFFTKEIEVKPNETIPMTIDLDPPMSELSRADLVVRELDKLPEWELPMFDRDGSIFSNMVYKSTYSVIAFFDINEEPSTRMIPALESVCTNETTTVSVWGIHAGPVDKQKLRDFIKENNITFPITIDETGAIAEAFKLTRKENDKTHFNNLPSTILFYKGKILLWQEGYDLGIKDYVLDMVAYQKTLPW